MSSNISVVKSTDGKHLLQGLPGENRTVEDLIEGARWLKQQTGEGELVYIGEAGVLDTKISCKRCKERY